MKTIIEKIEDKNKYISKVALPNFIQNRFDVKYGEDYELYRIIEDNKNEIYIPVKMKGYEIEFGVWLLEINEKSFDAFVDYIFENYKECSIINIQNLLIPYAGLKKMYHYSISENSFDEYVSKLGKSTKETIKLKINRLNKKFNVEIIKYSGIENIQLELVEKYFEWKKLRINNVWIQEPLEYLKTYFVTDAYEILFDNKITACFFIVKIEDTVYIENYSYDTNYDKYSLGLLINYFIIKDSMENNIKYIDIGTGYSDSYKKHLYKDVKITYNGYIARKQNLIINNIWYFIKNISSYSTVILSNFVFIYTKNIIYYGAITNDNNVRYEEIESLDNLNKDIDILYIEDAYNAFDIINEIKNIDIKSICIKAEHDRTINKYVFEDLENILVNSGYCLIISRRENLFSYTYWINNKYKKDMPLNTNYLPKICLDVQKYIESSELKRKWIRKTLRFHKKEYINTIRPILDNYDNLYHKLEDKNIFRFMMNVDNKVEESYDNIIKFNDAIKSINLEEDYILFDFNSGTGSIIYTAHNLFKEIIGIEANSDMNKIAKRNLNKLKIRNYKLYNKNINDITVYDIKDVNIFYLFNPFVGNTFKDFINRIISSLEINNREIYIIYVNSLYRNYILDNYNNIFNHVKEIKYQDYSTDIYRAEQSRAEQSRAEQSRAEQSSNM